MTGHISGATIAEAVSVLDEIKRLWPNNGPVSLDLWMRAMRVRIELAATGQQLLLRQYAHLAA